VVIVKTSHRTQIPALLLLACVWLVFALGNRLHAADATSVASKFPEPELVLADFTDPAEQYAASKILHDALNQALPGPVPALESGKVTAYSNAMLDVDFKRRQQATDAAEYERYSARIRQLLGDAGFRDRVLVRYQVKQLAGGAGAAGSGSPEPDELDVAMRRSLPYWVAALIVVTVLAPVFVLALDRRRLKGGGLADAATSVVALPDALSTIRVLGRQYDVQLLTCLVVDKESHTEHQVHVTATQGGPATVVGDQVFMPQPQFHTATTITRKDCLWVRGADGRESAWNFTNAALQARPSHVVSTIARRLKDGSLEFLLACNHSTGQTDTFAGLSNAHRTRWLLAWLATTFVGALGILLAFRQLLAGGGASVELRPMLQPSNWPYPLIAAGFVAALLVAISAWLIRRLRDWSFQRGYLRAFRNFFDQSRPAFLKPFGPR